MKDKRTEIKNCGHVNIINYFSKVYEKLLREQFMSIFLKNLLKSMESGPVQII